MRKTLTLVLVMLMVSMFAADCSGINQIRGSGNIVSKERKISGVEGVHLGTIGTLHVRIGGGEKLVVEAEDNLQEFIKTKMKGDVLTITLESEGGINATKDIHYYLTVKKLDLIKLSSAGDAIIEDDVKSDEFEIVISSAGDLKMQDIDAREVDISVSSAGDVSIKNLKAKELGVRISSAGDVVIGGGEVEEQDIHISSAGDYKADRLSCKDAEVMLNSSGDALIMVKDRLDATISSSGSLRYIGDPVVHSRTSSSGDIIRVKGSL